MKRRLKIVPSILLLVLCLGILGVGIYAAKPASNTISGTVTVNAANAEVRIETYLNGITDTLAPAYDTRTGGDITLNRDLEFVRKNAEVGEESLAYANTADEVADIEIFFKVYNHSTKPLAVYFSTSSLTSDIGTMVTTGGIAKATAEANIKEYIPNLGTSNEVEAFLSGYVSLPASSAEAVANKTGYSYAYAKVSFHLTKLLEDDDTITLTNNLFLNIEPYYTSISEAKKDIAVLYTGTTGKANNLQFTVTSEPNKEVSVKKDSTVSASSLTGTLILPSNIIKEVSSVETLYSVTMVEFSAFEGTNNELVRMDYGVVTLNGSFYNCSQLKYIIIFENGKFMFNDLGVDGFFDSCNEELYKVDNTNKIKYIKATVNGILNEYWAMFSFTDDITDPTINSACKFIGPWAGTSNGSGKPYGNLIIPDGVRYIGDQCFDSGLTLVKIPGSVREINYDAFGTNNTGLLTVILDNPMVANGLTSQNVYGNLIKNATTIYINQKLNVSNSTYLISNYDNNGEIVGHEGYNQWTIK